MRNLAEELATGKVMLQIIGVSGNEGEMKIAGVMREEDERRK
ncbi:hypothetical protein [Dickeya lacustris]|uniref:Uncharacterized protein n=1 Tax=Dickeya lacustris TaxID=2259638 RepID=A0ABY8G3H8_9GAMM|nr:hypothetical protein [Dickeya lacustris]WFN54495.1 hypothetical protein O1Q98_12460 [Dickeya lacustris]